MNRAFIFSAVLIAVSVISISIRNYFDDSQSLPAGDSAWDLHWEFYFADGEPLQEAKIATPIDTKFVQVFEQHITLRGMQIQRSRNDKHGNREIIAKVTRKNDIVLTIDFAVHLSPLGIAHYVKTRDALNSDRRQFYLLQDVNLPVNDESVQNIIHNFQEKTADPLELFNALFDFCYSNVKTNQQAHSNDVIDALTQLNTSELGKARTLVTLARAARIPSRIVTGLIIDENTEAELHHWVEINLKGEWLAYDPSEGFTEGVPANYLPVRKNGESVHALPQGMRLDHEFLEIIQRDVGINFKDPDKRMEDILNLNRLSLPTRLTLAFLLLLPLGALLTVFIRQIIGPNVYGTFTPTFFALAFTQVGWKIGSIIFVIVTIIGVFGRSMTPMLGLNRVSRLSMVFILVAISMIFSVSAMIYYNILPDGNIVLLPMVILTYMIDRIYKLADSDGVDIALIRLFWTFIVSAMVALLLQLDALGLWLLQYPEAHLTTAALVILIGQYKGKKWMHRMGLGWMLEPRREITEKTDRSENQGNGAL